ncbi:MAG TPA: MarR family transcriptional regulator [Burkholderiaceae bacterium]|nr:MarR family transcriptional regulator [Burkholderiaceae bacterium]
MTRDAIDATRAAAPPSPPARPRRVGNGRAASAANAPANPVTPAAPLPLTAQGEIPFINGYLPYLLARASHLVSGEFHRVLAARRVPVMQWRVMASLYDGPLTAKALADVILMKQPTVSRIIERMERQGLLQRCTNADDRRSILLSLTERGRAVALPLIESAREHEAAVLRPFGRNNAATLIRVLQRLIDQHSRDS